MDIMVNLIKSTPIPYKYFLIIINIYNNKMDLEKINTKVDELSLKMDTIIKLLSQQTENCNKMGEHIDFIEDIYETVKHPIEYICGTINRNNIKPLPVRKRLDL